MQPNDWLTEPATSFGSLSNISGGIKHVHSNRASERANLPVL